MASKAPKQPKSSEPKNERLALVSALSAIATKGDGWIKSIEDFKAVRQDILTNLENELQTLKRQREESQQEFEQNKRAKKIDLEQEVSEYGYQAALKILGARKETAVLSVELEQLKTRVRDLESQGDTQVRKTIEEERASAAKALTIEKKTLTLEHQKEIASLTSQVESLKQQLTSARAEIEKAETRLDQTRELVRSVADSCKTPSIVQNLSK